MRYLIAAIFLGAAFRIGLLCASYGWFPNGDPLNYLALAQSVAAGNGLVRYESIYGGELRAFYPPLYPLMLGVLHATSQPAILAVNFAIDLCATLVLVRLATSLTNQTFGRLIGAAYVLWPLNILSATAPQKEGLSALLVILSAHLLVNASRRPSIITPVLFGGLVGLLGLTQPALLPLPGLLALVLFKRFEPRIWARVVVISVAACALVMLPWWVRNYIIFGEFVPLTTSGGLSLWVGAFSPTGGWIPPKETFLVGSEIEIGRLAAREAWLWIQQHPAEYLLHCVMKVVRTLLGVGWALDRLLITTQMPVEIMKPPILALNVLLSAAAAVGLVIGRGVSRALLLACIVHLFVFQMWFEVAERHAYYLIPFMMLCAVAGWEKLRRREPRLATDFG